MVVRLFCRRSYIVNYVVLAMQIVQIVLEAWGGVVVKALRY